jgi:hypothetical protein
MLPTNAEANHSQPYMLEDEKPQSQLFDSSTS